MRQAVEDSQKEIRQLQAAKSEIEQQLSQAREALAIREAELSGIISELTTKTQEKELQAQELEAQLYETEQRLVAFKRKNEISAARLQEMQKRLDEARQALTRQVPTRH